MGFAPPGLITRRAEPIDPRQSKVDRLKKRALLFAKAGEGKHVSGLGVYATTANAMLPVVARATAAALFKGARELQCKISELERRIDGFGMPKGITV